MLYIYKYKVAQSAHYVLIMEYTPNCIWILKNDLFIEGNFGIYQGDLYKVITVSRWLVQ